MQVILPKVLIYKQKDKNKYITMLLNQNLQQSHDITIGENISENVSKYEFTAGSR
jgi:hypothetical protein